MFDVMHHHTPNESFTSQKIMLQDTVTGSPIPAHVHYRYAGESLPHDIEQKYGQHIGTVELDRDGHIKQVHTHPAVTPIRGELERLELEPPIYNPNDRDTIMKTYADDLTLNLSLQSIDNRDDQHYTSMELEKTDEATDRHISTLLNEFHSNHDKLSSLLSDDELRRLLNESIPSTIQSPIYKQQQVLKNVNVLDNSKKRRSRPQLKIATAQPGGMSPTMGVLDTLNTPSRKCAFNLVSPYKCNQPTTTLASTSTQCIPQQQQQQQQQQQLPSPLLSPFKGPLAPFSASFTPVTAINSRERVEKQLHDALESIRGQVSSVLSMADDPIYDGDISYSGVLTTGIKEDEINPRKLMSKRRLDFMNNDR
jgi:hypothetical protein